MSRIKPLPKSVLKELKEQNKARRVAGLEEIQLQIRECSLCEKLFESMGNRNCGCNALLKTTAAYDPFVSGLEQAQLFKFKASKE